MFIVKKLFNGLTLRCLGALSMGFAVVSIITTALLVLSGPAEVPAAVKVSAYTIKFPEDEETLKQLSAEMLGDEGSALALQDIQPASGPDSRE
jgi:hypothetical protein